MVPLFPRTGGRKKQHQQQQNNNTHKTHLHDEARLSNDLGLCGDLRPLAHNSEAKVRAATASTTTTAAAAAAAAAT